MSASTEAGRHPEAGGEDPDPPEAGGEDPGEAGGDGEDPDPPEADPQREARMEAIQNLKDSISDRINTTLQFTNLYFVFQGMVFSYIVSSSTKINCKVKWIPFTLSLLVSIFNFIAICVNIRMTLDLYKALVVARIQLNTGPDANDRERGRDDYLVKQRKVVSWLTLLLLLVFMGVMLWGCSQIECEPIALKDQGDFHIM